MLRITSYLSLWESKMSGAMVMLNEFFQTTSYAESAQSLYHILQYLSAQHICWICVTHLLDLFELYYDDAYVSKIEIKNHKAQLYIPKKQ